MTPLRPAEILMAQILLWCCLLMGDVLAGAVA